MMGVGKPICSNGEKNEFSLKNRVTFLPFLELTNVRLHIVAADRQIEVKQSEKQGEKGVPCPVPPQENYR